MTERAAHRVLGLVEESLPRLEAHARLVEVVAERTERETSCWSANNKSNLPLAQQWTTFARGSAMFVTEQRQTLTEIMVAQDFQDLSGQVIKRVIAVIMRTETQLLELLVDEIPGAPAPAPTSELQGPQAGNALQQDDVDDLLASLAF